MPTFCILALQAERKKEEREKRESEGCYIQHFRKLYFVNQTLSNRIVFILLSLAEKRSYSLMAEGIILADGRAMKELGGQMFLLLHLGCTTICDHSNLGRMSIHSKTCFLSSYTSRELGPILSIHRNTMLPAATEKS